MEKLREKLLSPQPAKRRVLQYKLYHCQWKIGDTYAYKIENNTEFYGCYLLAQKVGEDMWWPGHTVPTVYVKITKNQSVPKNIEEYNRLEFIQTDSVSCDNPFVLNSYTGVHDKAMHKFEFDEYGFLPIYRINLLNTSERVIPKKLIYLGNFDGANPPPKELIPYMNRNLQPVCWNSKHKTFEGKMLKYYNGYNLRGFQFYKK